MSSIRNTRENKLLLRAVNRSVADLRCLASTSQIGIIVTKFDVKKSGFTYRSRERVYTSVLMLSKIAV